MIFVTVGTHEDQFNRLIEEMDRIKESGSLQEDVFIQTGYSDYKPIHCRNAVSLGYQEIDQRMKEARVVITHGGPGSIMHALRYNKIPIVVPRQKWFGEHIDNHQVLFSQRMALANKAMIVLEISELEGVILKYDELVREFSFEAEIQSNLDQFVEELDKITLRLLKK